MKDGVYIFKLEMFNKGPFSEGFAFANDASLTGRLSISQDFMPVDPSDRHWKATRLSAYWKPRKVIGAVDPQNDFPWFGVHIPGFSQRAVDCLREFLEPNGEILPVIAPHGLGKYWAYNITTVADVLDDEHSAMRLFPGSAWDALAIERHIFFPDRLGSLSIFRIPNRSLNVYATGNYMQRVHECGLKGLSAVRVWPEPRDPVETKVSQPAGRTPRPRREVGGKERDETAYTARAPQGKELHSLRQSILQYSEELGWGNAALKPEELQTRIFDALERLRASERNASRLEDRSFWLGIAWGESIVRALGWEWVMLENPKLKAMTPAVANPNRSLVVTPLQLIERIATNPSADPNSQLLFNMIKAGKFPEGPTGSLKLIGLI